MKSGDTVLINGVCRTKITAVSGNFVTTPRTDQKFGCWIFNKDTGAGVAEAEGLRIEL